MAPRDKVEIASVDGHNVERMGFFCYKSKPKSPGYQRKLKWLRRRFAEGMRMHILYENGRSAGFIEYMPGEYGWRAVNAADYLLIHCLWVVGRGKGKGYGSRLLDLCETEARRQGRAGVAMVTSGGNWLAGKDVLLRRGYEAVDSAPPSFELLTKRLGEGPRPSFPTDWDDRANRFGPGLTVLRTDQCPYLDDAVSHALNAASERGLPAREVLLESAEEVREKSPSAYGVFALVLDGRLLSYHYVLAKELVALLDRSPG